MNTMKTIKLQAKFITINSFSQLIFENNEQDKAEIMNAVNQLLRLSDRLSYKLPFSNDGKYYRVNLPPWEKQNLRLKLQLDSDLRKKQVIVTVVVKKYNAVDNLNIEHKGISLVYESHRVTQVDEELDDNEPEITSD